MLPGVAAMTGGTGGPVPGSFGWRTGTLLSPTVFTVTGTGDSPSDPYTATSGDLRYCVGLANANTSNPNGSLIEFEPTVFSSPQTITLGSGLVLTNMTDQTTITGPPAALTVSGGGPSSDFSVFTVGPGVTASILALTIANGNAGQGVYYGGGIANYGNLTLSNDTISGNTASSSGGGIDNAGSATLTNVTVCENSAAYGGGLYNEPYDSVAVPINEAGVATLTNVTIAGNSAVDGGGGITTPTTLQPRSTTPSSPTARAEVTSRSSAGASAATTTSSTTPRAPAGSPTESTATSSASTRCWRRWATTAGRPRPWHCFPVARRLTREVHVLASRRGQP